MKDKMMGYMYYKIGGIFEVGNDEFPKDLPVIKEGCIYPTFKCLHSNFHSILKSIDDINTFDFNEIIPNYKNYSLFGKDDHFVFTFFREQKNDGILTRQSISFDDAKKNFDCVIGISLRLLYKIETAQLDKG